MVIGLLLEGCGVCWVIITMQVNNKIVIMENRELSLGSRSQVS